LKEGFDYFSTIGDVVYLVQLSVRFVSFFMLLSAVLRIKKIVQ
jgi:hypothetical protein